MSSTSKPFVRKNSAWKKRMAALAHRKECTQLEDNMKSFSISEPDPVDSMGQHFSRLSVKGERKRCRMEGCKLPSDRKPSDINFTPKRNEVYCESHWYAAQAWRLHKQRTKQKLDLYKRVAHGEGAYFAGAVYVDKNKHILQLSEVTNMCKPHKKEHFVKEDGTDKVGGDGQYDDE